MSNVVILTDSTAYIPAEISQTMPIRVIPLSLILDGKSYRDGIDIMPDEFYQQLKNSNTLPQTSQVTVSEYEQMFADLLEEGYQILNLGLSSGISSSHDSALQAQKKFAGKPIEIIDTKLVSMALGFQVLAAARAAQAGASLAECKATALEAYDKIGVYFTVDSLKYLAAGGRINSARRIMGTALDIKPVLEIRDGKIELVESVRSKKKAVHRMVALVEKGIAGRQPVRLSVFHALDREAALALQAELEEHLHPLENILSFVSPVVGAHVGPGTLSIAYMAG